MYVCCRGEHRCLWASVLFGRPSFVHIPNPYQAVIQPLQQFNGDPAHYTAGNSVGMVGVMLENRRRNLLNGIITSRSEGSLSIDVYRALGNCPKYIQGNSICTFIVNNLYSELPAKPDQLYLFSYSTSNTVMCMSASITSLNIIASVKRHMCLQCTAR